MNYDKKKKKTKNINIKFRIYLKLNYLVIYKDTFHKIKLLHNYIRL